MSEVSQFDGELLGLTVGDIEFENGGFALWLLSQDRESAFPLDPMLFRALDLRDLGGKNSPAGSWCDEIFDEHDPDVLDVVAAGRLRLNMLVNSRGGLGILADSVSRGVRRIRKNGGVSRSFALKKAHSAAGLIWRDADERYVTRDTVSLWHAPRRKDGTVYSDLVEPTKLEIVEFLQAHAFAGSVRERAIAAVQASPDATVRLSSVELLKLGLAHGVHGNTNAVLKRLAGEIGMSVGGIADLLRMRLMSCAPEATY